jgi:hypothetical protein
MRPGLCFWMLRFPKGVYKDEQSISGLSKGRIHFLKLRPILELLLEHRPELILGCVPVARRLFNLGIGYLRYMRVVPQTSMRLRGLLARVM